MTRRNSFRGAYSFAAIARRSTTTTTFLSNDGSATTKLAFSTPPLSLSISCLATSCLIIYRRIRRRFEHTLPPFRCRLLIARWRIHAQEINSVCTLPPRRQRVISKKIRIETFASKHAHFSLRVRESNDRRGRDSIADYFPNEERSVRIRLVPKKDRTKSMQLCIFILQRYDWWKMIILGDEVAKEFPRKIYPTNLVKTNRTGGSGIKFRLCSLRGKSLMRKNVLWIEPWIFQKYV